MITERIRSRDTRVELLRLLACLFVVSLHTKPGSSVAGVPVFGRILYSNLITDGVSIFLLISGFYFFSGVRYLKRLKRCALRIVLPTFAFIIFLLILPSFYGQGQGFSPAASQFFRCLIHWDPQLIHGAAHLWYMFLYILIIAVSPALVFLHEKLGTFGAGKAVELLAAPGVLLLNDLLGNRLLHCTQWSVSCLIPGALILMSGAALYGLRETFEGKRWPAVPAMVIFLLLNIHRSLQLANGSISVSESMFCFYGWVCAVCLCVTVLSFHRGENRGTGIAVNFLASFTEGVYLIHIIVNEWLFELGVKTALIGAVTNGADTTWQYLKFAVVYAGTVFLASALITAAVRLILLLLKKAVPERNKDAKQGTEL